MKYQFQLSFKVDLNCKVEGKQRKIHIANLCCSLEKDIAVNPYESKSIFSCFTQRSE